MYEMSASDIRVFRHLTASDVRVYPKIWAPVTTLAVMDWQDILLE
jgi:hypothetical protein